MVSGEYANTPSGSCTIHATTFRRRRGRDASCPTPPAQIPACSFPAPGSSTILASAQGSARRSRQSHPWSDPWLGYLEVLQQLTEGFPAVTRPLTPPVEPLPQNSHRFVKELLQARVVAADSIIVVVSLKFRPHLFEPISNSAMPLFSAPLGKTVQ